VIALMAAVGPELMQAAFGDRFDYDRLGLVLVAAAMGFYLSATTLSQAALAHGAAARAARCWVISAASFLAFCIVPLIADEDRRIEVGFLAAAILLALQLGRVYRTVPDERIGPGSPEEIEARLAAADEVG
jgi:hypothetical protein